MATFETLKNEMNSTIHNFSLKYRFRKIHFLIRLLFDFHRQTALLLASVECPNLVTICIKLDTGKADFLQSWATKRLTTSTVISRSQPPMQVQNKNLILFYSQVKICSLICCLIFMSVRFSKNDWLL
jgi:hypothetical protein